MSENARGTTTRAQSLSNRRAHADFASLRSRNARRRFRETVNSSELAVHAHAVTSI